VHRIVEELGHAAVVQALLLGDAARVAVGDELAGLADLLVLEAGLEPEVQLGAGESGIETQLVGEVELGLARFPLPAVEGLAPRLPAQTDAIG
jgi:hypothetical protein